jgi:multidrug efflux system membrane fusion protein
MRPIYRRWLRRFALLIAVIAVIVVFAHRFQKNAKSAQTPASQAVPVVTAVAKKGDQPVYLTGLGTVTAFYTVTVRTRVDGQLMNVPVREGQMVSDGQLIAEIDPRPFEVQLLQAQGQLERDQAVLANAKIDLERYKVLYAQDSIPKQQLDTQVSTVNQFEAAVKSDTGAIESAKLQITYSRITSPVDGRIGLREVDPGNIVHASDTNGLAVITQLQPIAVIFNIAQDYIAPVMKKLRAGQSMPVEAYDRDFKTKLASGALTTIDNQVDVNTGTVRFKSVFPNKDNSLFPNQFVNARLLIDVQRGVVLVPASAVQQGPQSAFVFVVKSDGTVEMRNITAGIIEHDTAAIQKGLSAGETVVTEGLDKLQQGMKVTERQQVSTENDTGVVAP